jgi:hypothetical protein
LDHLGTVLQRLTGIERVYLERDTADIVLGDTTNPAVTLTGPGRGPADANLHPLAGFRFGGNYTLVALEVSPTGEHVGYVGVGFIDFECVPGVPVNFFDVRAEVVPVAGGSPTVVWRTSNVGCDGTTQFATGLGWNHTGDAAAFAVNLDDAMGFFSGRLLEWQRPGSSVRNAVIPGTTITGARYSADDRTLTLYQPDIGLTSCQEAVHDLSASGFGDVIGNPISVSPTLCTYGQGRTVQPNLRPLSVTPPGLSIRRQATLRPKRLLARTN